MPETESGDALEGVPGVLSTAVKRLALYALGTMVIAGIVQISDSVRPPYVGWKTEVLVAAVVLATLRFIVWREIDAE